MKRRTTLLVSAVLLALLAGPACADRVSEDRARAFAALPNWTGLWETEAAVRLRNTGRLEPPQLWGKPPYNAEWAQRSERAAPNGGAAAPVTDLPPAVKVCDPGGFPAVMESPVGDSLFELLVTPEQTLLVSTYSVIRHIYTDGRAHPKPEDLWPTADGDSIGRWEGETLVIDTVARTAGPLGPVPGAASLSAAARFTERLRRLDDDTLQNDITIDDPERFSRPWQFSVRYQRVRDVDRMITVNCRENDRNPIVDGAFVITPP